MIQFTNLEKRWLEIVYYLICNKIFSINQKTSDIIQFFEGYRWTNMFKCDILIDTLTKDKILLDSNFVPSRHEFLITIHNPESRLRIDYKGLKELVLHTRYNCYRSAYFHAQMKEEINKTDIFPKLNTPQIHETIYSFLLALRYIADIVKTIKF